MVAVYATHIAAGSIGLITGFTALYASKGSSLHRRSGMAFFYAMLAMCLFGTIIAAVRGVAPAVNIPAGVMTAYLVLTGTLTVKRPAAWPRWLDAVLTLAALGIAMSDVTFAFEALTSESGRSHGFPAFPFILFGTVGLLGVAGDLRVMKNGPLTGAPRLARHLWRMCMALWIAAMSFFIGQAKVFPKPIRIYPLLAVPVLLVLVTMIYWLWRVRVRRSMRGLVTVTA
jgi:hypothetical protein